MLSLLAVVSKNVPREGTKVVNFEALAMWTRFGMSEYFCGELGGWGGGGEFRRAYHVIAFVRG